METKKKKRRKNAGLPENRGSLKALLFDEDTWYRCRCSSADFVPAEGSIQIFQKRLLDLAVCESGESAEQKY